MCGIVGGISQRELSAILLEGLRRLEYRGYDSAGMAVVTASAELKRLRTPGKVQRPCRGDGTRSATRHPGHRPHPLGDPWRALGAQRTPPYCRDRCAVVHNGIIENHEAAARRADRRRPRVHLRHRYRGHRPRDLRSAGGRKRTLGCGPQHGRAFGRRLRAGCAGHP